MDRITFILDIIQQDQGTLWTDTNTEGPYGWTERLGGGGGGGRCGQTKRLGGICVQTKRLWGVGWAGGGCHTQTERWHFQTDRKMALSDRQKDGTFRQTERWHFQTDRKWSLLDRQYIIWCFTSSQPVQLYQGELDRQTESKAFGQKKRSFLYTQTERRAF